ncbi:MAG: cell division protein FtsN [Klebsiella michiganensis]|nr:cell division protein FtsN [Klebsiella michiganensis]
MAQRDYVRRSQPASSRRKKSNTRSSRNKQGGLSAVSPTMVAIAAAVLVAFIGGLYFITHHKKEEAEALQNRQAAGNGLPPKPEERWRYIKELESRQPGVRAPTEPTAGGEVMKPEQLTDEQRQLLAQMQADMRQQPTQLTEVPWNEQTPAQRQQTLQRQRLVQQQQLAQVQQQTQTQVQQPRTQPRAVEQPKPVQQPPKQTASNQQPYQDLLQTPAHTSTAQPKTQAAAPVTRVEEAPKTAAAEKKDDRSWMIQCGSFKGAEQAETVRAQLAFEGYASNMIERLKMAGHANCIRLAARG